MKRALRGFFTLAVILAWGAYLWRNWNLLADYDWKPDPFSLLAALFFAMAYWLGLGFSWQKTLVASGGRLKASTGVRIWTRSMLARYLPGNVWHILARLYMAEEEGESRSPVFASTVLEQILTLVAALLVFGLMLPLMPTLSMGYFGMLLVIPVGLIAVHPLFLGRGALLLGRVLGVPFTTELPRYSRVLILLFSYALSNLLAGFALWFVIAGVGSVPLTQLPTVIGAFCAAWAAGYLSFLTPGGIGVREGALTIILSPLTGVPLAMAAGLLCRVIFTVGELGTLVAVNLSEKYLRTRSKRFV